MKADFKWDPASGPVCANIGDNPLGAYANHAWTAGSSPGGIMARRRAAAKVLNLIHEALARGEPMTANAIATYVNERSHWGTSVRQVANILISRKQYVKVGYVGSRNNIFLWQIGDQ